MLMGPPPEGYNDRYAKPLKVEEFQLVKFDEVCLAEADLPRIAIKSTDGEFMLPTLANLGEPWFQQKIDPSKLEQAREIFAQVSEEISNSPEKLGQYPYYSLVHVGYALDGGRFRKGDRETTAKYFGDDWESIVKKFFPYDKYRDRVGSRFSPASASL